MVEPDWFDVNWTNRKKITILNTKVTADLTGFPILFSRTDTDFQAARTDGFDFVITKADGTTEVPYEREKWNDATGELVLWFKGDILDLTDVDFYIYYNNSGQQTDKADPENVWDSNYKQVSHLHDDFLDSTSNNNDGTNDGSTNASGKIADGREFDNVDDRITHGDIHDFERTDTFTLSCWVKSALAAPTQLDFILTKLAQGGSIPGYALALHGSVAGDPYDFQLRGVTNGQKVKVRFTRPSNTNFQYVVVTYDGSSLASGVSCYVNGSLQTNTVVDDDLASSILNNASFDIGDRDGNLSNFAGVIDEVRASDIERSPTWISTESNNQDDPGSFYTVAAEESVTNISISETMTTVSTEKLEKTNFVMETASNLETIILDKNFKLSDSFLGSDSQFVISKIEFQHPITIVETAAIRQKFITISQTISNVINIFKQADHILPDSITNVENIIVGKSVKILDSLSIASQIIVGKSVKILDSLSIASQIIVDKILTIPDSLTMTTSIFRVKSLKILDTFSISSLVKVSKDIKIPDTISISEIIISFQSIIIPNSIDTNRVIASPIQDISNVGGWVDTEHGDSDGILYDELDEVITDDDTSAISLLKVPAISDTVEVKLATITDPSQNSGIKIKIRARGDGDTKIRGILLEGAATIATTPWHTLGIGYDSFEYELSEAEAASITDFTDLRIRLEPELQ